MPSDAHKNFSYSTIATAPSPATTGTSLIVQSGDGAIFPSVSFNATIWPADTQPLTTNAEIVRVTAISTDTFTITRDQESSNNKSIVVGDQIAATITNKTLTDVEDTLIDEHSDVDTTTSAPILNDVLKWDGSNFVPGTAGDTTEFTFTQASFTASGISGTKLIGLGDFKAIGAIQFDVVYTNPPGGMTAVVAMTGSATNWAGDLSMTGTPPDGPTTNTEAVEWPSARTGSLTFTITPSNSPTPATLTDVQAFRNTMRYGSNANSIGNQTKDNLEALTEVSGPNESRSQTINNIPTATGGHYLTFAYADSLSDVAQVRRNKDSRGYITASFNSTDTTLAPAVQTGITNVANSNNFSETFACITSRLSDMTDNTDDFQLLTSSAAQNYIYWGEHTVDAVSDGNNNYNEAAVEDNIATEPGRVASNSMSSRNMIVNATESQYSYIAYPSRLGAITSIKINDLESITDFWIDAGSGTELAITNDAGYKENYYVYVSKNPGFTNPTTMVVTI